LLNSSGTDSAIIRPIANVQEALVYTDIVKPVLQTKCYGCHGPQKQKGGLRVDDSTHLLKGSEDGPVLIAGKPTESELIKSLLLPREDKKHMPPKEKPQLTQAQIQVLHWWVEQGAPFHKKVKELEQPEKLKPTLATLQTGEVKKETVPALPDKPVTPADAKAVAALREKGVMVLPVAQGSNYLVAHFINASEITDSDVALLLPLKEQLVWLKLGNTKISDSALKAVGQCTNLHALWLNQTAITDNGLPALKNLKSLQTLNLVGTGVTSKGLVTLQDLQQLKTLYLYQTGVNQQGWSVLKKTFSHTVIDTGGYAVPTLPTDTVEVTAAKR
jgi:mono/diheme cytochrome c family protein